MADKYLGERQKTLKLVAQDLRRRAESLSDAKERELLTALIDNLQDFGDRHAEYFQSEEAQNSIPSAFTPDYTYRVLANQFGNDLSVIEQVIAQRESNALRLTLEMGDRLAQRMLQPAIDAAFLSLKSLLISRLC